MGIEKRGNHYYFYAKKREGGKVVSRYVAGGEVVAHLARIDKMCREEKQYERDCQREADQSERDEYERTGAELEQALNFIQTVTRAALVATGHHTHKGQWRKARKNAAATGQKDRDSSKA